MHSAGDKVTAGTLCRSGSLVCTARSLGRDTVLQQIVDTVQRCQSSKAPVQRLADKIAGIFVPVIIAIAAIVFCIWYFLADPGNLDKAVYTMCGVLIIACPCALGRAIAYTQSVKSMVFTMAGLAVCLIGLDLWGLLPNLSALLRTSQKPCELPKGLGGKLAGMPLLIDFATRLMPCGALYAAWIQAAAAGGAL